MEESIKSAAWRMAELEENLYLKFGGAKVIFNEAHLVQTRATVNSLYSPLIVHIWDLMVQNW